jgi:outer membrane protein assembly factor BamE (lipoprotein component of BamABCDE complex)
MIKATLTRKYSLKIILTNVCCLAALFIVGCTVGQAFDVKKINNLKVGQTSKEEVLGIFGKPYSSSAAILMYLYAEDGKSRMLTVSVDSNNKVSRWNLISFDGSSLLGKAIKTEKINQIKKGVTTKEDVITILGKPTSITTNSSNITSLSYTRIQEKKSGITPVDVAVFGVVGSLLRVKTVERQVDELMFTIGPNNKVADVSTTNFSKKY